MSHWNIRILRDEYPDGTEYFFPAEVYYDDDGVPDGYGGYSSEGDTVADVVRYAKDVVLAERRPVLYAGERFPQEYKPEV